MKQEERKLRVKRMLAGVMSAMMLISAADVSGWGSVVVKAEETAAETHHFDSNGFCTDKNCDGYEPAVLTTDKYDIDDDQKMDEVYEIANAGELYWFAGLINGTLPEIEGKTWANAVLTSDITINQNVVENGKLSANYARFRKWSVMNTFQGVFDGSGHKISGLYVDRADGEYVGLFGRAFQAVRNIELEDYYIAGDSKVGAIAGENQGTISYCRTNGIVTGRSAVGGISGYSIGTIADCAHAGAVKGNGECEYIGGISGQFIANENRSVINCCNTGYVSAYGTVMNIGGICGYFSTAKANGSMKNIYNTGMIFVEGKANGLGEICGMIVASESGDVAIENSYSVGERVVMGSGRPSDFRKNVGKFYGYMMGKGTFKNCVHATSSASDNSNGMIDRTDEQFENGEVAYLLQGDQSDQVWGQNIGTDKIPVLRGPKVYRNDQYSGCSEGEGGKTGVIYSNKDYTRYSHDMVKTDAVEPKCTTAGNKEYFTCSKCGKMYLDSDGTVFTQDVPMIEALGHDYSTDVKVSEDKRSQTITLTCNRTECTAETSGHTEQFTVSKPDDLALIYDGTEKGLTVEDASGIVGKEVDIVYVYGDDPDDILDGKPVYSGDYTAYVTMGEDQETIASVSYSIQPKELTIVEATARNMYYDGRSIVSIADVKLSGIVGDDNVFVYTAGLYGKLSSAAVGTYQKVTLEGLQLSGVNEAEYTISQDAVEVTLSPAVEILPLIYTDDTIELTRKYIYAKNSTDSIDLSQMIPSAAGKVTYTVTTDDTKKQIAYETEPAMNGNILKYTVKSGDIGASGTITVKVESEYYRTYEICIHVELTDKYTVTLGEGQVVALSDAASGRYGQILSSLALKEAVFVDRTDESNIVAGTLQWKTPDQRLKAGQMKAEWIFIPEDTATYETLEGLIIIPVAKADPVIKIVPEAGALIEGGSLAQAVLSGGEAVFSESTESGSSTEKTVEGHFEWKDPTIVPTAADSGKTKYQVIFYPADTENYNEAKAEITLTVNAKQESSTTGSDTNVGTTDSQPSDMDTANKPEKKGTKFTIAKYKGLQFTVTSAAEKNPTVSCKGVKSAKGKITIPATVIRNGITYKVTEIQAKAFKDKKKVTSVTVGKNITKIGKQAFAGCKGLKKITVKSNGLTAKSVKNGAFSKITGKTTIIVPKKKLKVYKKLFVKKGLSSKIKMK